MDVLDFVFRCISLLVRFMKKDVEIVYVVLDLFQEVIFIFIFLINYSDQMNESDCEKYFEG